MKRLVIIGIVAIIILSLAGVYLFLMGGWEKFFVAKTDNNTAAGSPQPRPEEQTIISVGTRTVVGPTLSSTQDKLYYFDPSGQLYRIKLDGTGEETFGFVNVAKTTAAKWPDNGGDIIVEAVRAGFDGAAYRLYLASTGVFKDLPINIESIDWLPGGKQYAYVWHRPMGGYDISVADSATGSFTKAGELSSFHYLTAAPAGNFVLLREPAEVGKVNKVLRLDLNTKQVSTLLDRGTNFGVLVSPDGSKMLFTRLNSNSGLPELWVSDLAKNTFTNLGINTAVAKIVWNKNSTKFYYALAQTISKNDLQVLSQTGDQLYLYDLTSNDKIKIDLGGKTPDFRDILVTDDGKMLFFRDGQDGKLYRINL